MYKNYIYVNYDLLKIVQETFTSKFKESENNFSFSLEAQMGCSFLLTTLVCTQLKRETRTSNMIITTIFALIDQN